MKITDFGITTELDSTCAQANSFVGTLTYMSPERIEGGGYTFSSDIWSFGLSLMACALGRFPIDTEGGYWGMLQASIADRFLTDLTLEHNSNTNMEGMQQASSAVI